jgi:hypothetical protein
MAAMARLQAALDKTCVLTICWAEAMVAIKMPTVMITTATYFDLEYLTKAMQ